MGTQTHTDALATLGTILDDTAKRDAIHIAVEPVEAAETLHPGVAVTLDHRPGQRSVARMRRNNGEELYGLVDPFLTTHVRRGQIFWLYLYPRTITSLRHEWEHPLFPKQEPSPAPEDGVGPATVAEIWLRDYAVQQDMEFDRMINALREAAETGDNWVFVGDDEPNNRHIEPMVWSMLEIYLGKTFGRDWVKPEYYSCGC